MNIEDKYLTDETIIYYPSILCVKNEISLKILRCCKTCFFYKVEICKNDDVMKIIMERPDVSRKIKTFKKPVNGVSTFPNYCCKFYKGV